VLSMNLVLAEPQEGLWQIRSNIVRFESWSQQVQKLTEVDSVIVTGSTDKLFWPERQVIYALTRAQDYQAVRSLLDARVPVYSFHPTYSSADITYLNVQLSGFGLRLEPVRYGFQDFSLYRFIPVAKL